VSKVSLSEKGEACSVGVRFSLVALSDGERLARAWIPLQIIPDISRRVSILLSSDRNVLRQIEVLPKADRCVIIGCYRKWPLPVLWT
jgi:hypothetical protein